MNTKGITRGLTYVATAAAMATNSVSMAATSNVVKNSTADSSQPNVIMILVDDLSYFGVSAYGLKSVTGMQHFKDEPLQTPNMDRLAREGVLCTHAYSHALSEATRVALMTGMNNGRNYLVPKSLHESQIIFSDVFRRGGYATGMYGKWKQSRGTVENPALRHLSAFSWDDYSCFDVITEGQRHINPNIVENGKAIDYKGRTDKDPRTDERWFGEDMFCYKSMDFIEANKNNPFFLYYSMVMIHDDHKATPDSKPDGVFENADESKENDMREYLPDMIRYTDKMIGNIIDKVEELGLRDNTLIVVMGDNGSKEFITFEMEDGTVHKGGKGHTRYSGEQVPLIFSMPGAIPAGDGEIRRYEPTVDLTDIYPTLLTAAGVDIPNRDKIDGVSLWGQLTGKESKPHRDYIYKWYNANNTYDNHEKLMRYAQTADFKYYAPHADYPEGRFFDLRVDPLEEAGEKGRKLGWMNYWYSGLKISKLNKEQKAAYEMLKKETERHAYTPVKSIKIGAAPKSMSVGSSVDLPHVVSPSNATRNGVVWSSSAPEIASVDKFGRVTAHKAGEVTISLYSWEDAEPLANGSKIGGYKTNGLTDQVKISVK